jgi:hypothetical protein
MLFLLFIQDFARCALFRIFLSFYNMPKTTKHFPQFGTMPEKSHLDASRALRRFPLLPDMSQTSPEGHNAVKTEMENTQVVIRKTQMLTLQITQLAVSPPELVSKTESAEPYRNRRSEWPDWPYWLSSLLHLGDSRVNQYREQAILEYKRLIALPAPAPAVDEDDEPPAYASVRPSQQPKGSVERHCDYWEGRYVILCSGVFVMCFADMP